MTAHILHGVWQGSCYLRESLLCSDYFESSPEAIFCTRCLFHFQIVREVVDKLSQHRQHVGVFYVEYACTFLIELFPVNFAHLKDPSFQEQLGGIWADLFRNKFPPNAL